ncbi:MAG: hypothetical protein WC300_02670, partial [Candidatus Omnitrophota bacterium]
MLIFLIVAVLVCLIFILISIIFDNEIRAVFDRDPAAAGRIEVVFTYAGLHAIVLFRIAHFFYGLKMPLLPRLISQTG